MKLIELIKEWWQQVRSYAKQLMGRRQKRTAVGQERLQRAKAYIDWSQSICYKERVEGLRNKLRDLNRKYTVSGEEALMLQGTRLAIQELLDNFEADERDARQIMEQELKKVV